MKKHLLLLAILLQTILAEAQKYEWLNYSTQGQALPGNAPVAVDPFGNSYTIVFTPLSGTTIQGTSFPVSVGPNGQLLAKFDPSGNLIWGKMFGSGSSKHYHLACDNAGAVYYASEGGSVVTDDTSFSCGPAVFKIDSNGHFIRYISYSGYSTSPVIAVFGTDVYVETLGAVQKLDSAFNVIWSVTENQGIAAFVENGGGSGNTDIYVQDNGELIVTAFENSNGVGPVPFGNDTIPFTIGGTDEIAIVKMDTSGQVLWSRTIPWNSYQRTAAALDHAGNAYLTFMPYLINGVTHFAGDSLLNPIGANQYSAILKWDASGNEEWCRAIYQTNGSFDGVSDLAINAQNEILMKGNGGGITFNGDTTLGMNVGGPYRKLFIVKADNAGTFKWYKTELSNALTSMTGGEIAVRNGNEYIVTGVTESATATTNWQFACTGYAQPINTYNNYITFISEQPEPIPAVAFDYLTEGNTVYFENKSDSYASFNWDFDDGQSSTTLVNPAHYYANPGFYNVCLTTTSNCAISNTACKSVLLQGIDKVEPGRIANTGFFRLKILGGFPSLSGTVKFIKAGFPDIIPDTIFYISNGVFQANIKIENAPLGLWDVVVESGTLHDTLYNALTLEVPNNISPELKIIGRNRILATINYTFKVAVTNNSNQTLIGVPVYVQMSKDFIGNVVGIESSDSLCHALLDSMGTNFGVIKDTLSGDSILFGAIIIPFLNAYSTSYIDLSLKNSTMGIKEITAIVGHAFYDSLNYNDLGLKTMSSCHFLPPCLQLALDLAGLAPGPIGCAAASINLGCSIGNLGTEAADGNHFLDLGVNLVSTLLGCSPLSPALMILNMGATGVGAIASSSPSGSGCLPPIGSNKHSVIVSNSLDPNSKTGPVGSTPDNFINNSDRIFYTINFENADTATAPASQVEILDTLDASVFDLSSLQFTGFGFGDSSYNFNIMDNTFIKEISMYPVKDIVLRIQGSLDTATHVLRVKFASLDTLNYDITQDITQGFLNPNVTSPEGEGFIGFSLKLLPGLPHQQIISNSASIIFDGNAPVVTPAWINTIDTIKPASNVIQLPAVINDTLFTIHINGNDAHAGIHGYNLYVSVNDSAYFRFSSLFSGDSILLKGQFGDKYEFYSIAVDRAGNVEETPLDPDNFPDAVTTVLVGVEEILDHDFVLYQNRPNPFSNTTAIDYFLTKEGHITLDVIDVMGNILKRLEDGKQTPGRHNVTFNFAEFASGIYYYRMQTPSGMQIKKMSFINR